MMDSDKRLDLDRVALELRERIISTLGQPCAVRRGLDGGEWFVAGDPPEVVVRLDETTVSVMWYEAGWKGPHEPFSRAVPLVTVHWHEVEIRDVWLMCEMLIDKTRARRQATFGTCRYCGKTYGPEDMDEKDLCQGCAERHLGTVH